MGVKWKQSGAKGNPWEPNGRQRVPGAKMMSNRVMLNHVKIMRKNDVNTHAKKQKTGSEKYEESYKWVEKR